MLRKVLETKSHLVVELPVDRHPAEFFANCLERSFPVFLDSSRIDGRLGRFSIIGCDPFMVARSDKGATGNPFKVLGELLKPGLPLRASMIEDRPLDIPMIAGGAIGYLSYDAGRWLERMPSIALDDRGVPDLIVCLYDALAVFDEVEERAYLTAYRKEGESVGDLVDRLNRFAGLLRGGWEYRNRPFIPSIERLTSSFSKPIYLRAVEKAKHYIDEGDIFQVNLSQRFSLPGRGDIYALYKRLRRINPAPFSAYMDFGNFAIASSSPERFIRGAGGSIETRPIKGTRPRGTSCEEDDLLVAELIASKKDAAEHVMIVDVERNDFGRVCRAGSVKVPELMVVESYATVHHLVSTVVGELEKDKGIVDVLEASFPGGSITGAPKIRAMEIIEELEPVRRGVYTGTIFCCGFDGYLDSSIVIRTLTAVGGPDKWTLDFHLGGGIVADSDPEAEYRETVDKGRGLMEALGIDHDRIS